MYRIPVRIEILLFFIRARFNRRGEKNPGSVTAGCFDGLTRLQASHCTHRAM